MTRFCLRERGLESRLRTFNSQLLDCLATPLADRLEEWRRTVTQLDRENNKEWRRARNELQRVTGDFDKLNKRFRRKVNVACHNNSALGVGPDSTMGDNVQLNFLQHDLELKQRTLAELERSSLRRAVVEERRRFAELMTCLKPVLDSHTALFSDVTAIDECVATIGEHVFDPNNLPNETEQAIDEAVEQVSSRMRSSEWKLSEARSMLRLRKGSSRFESSHPNLSGHTSQLSLHSVNSSSTTTSWNAIAAAAASNALASTCSRSPSGSSCPAGRDIKPHSHGLFDTVNPSSPGNTNAGGDSVSLFENRVANSDVHSVECWPTAYLPSSYPDPIASAQNGACSDSQAPRSSLCSTFSRLNDVDPPSTPATRDEDVEAEDSEWATTEETEDGETEDEERLIATNAPTTSAEKPSSILYPDQAIPAPVYTNLNELQMAAARKFSTTIPSESQQPMSIPPPPDSDTQAHRELAFDALPSHQDTTESSMMESLSLGHVVSVSGQTCTSVSVDTTNEFVTTCVNSCTSTFRRRQSEYGRKLHSGSVDSPPTDVGGRQFLDGTSVTPCLTRRGNQTYAEYPERGTRPKPANPPRRSSSVSRELTHLRTSMASQNAAFPFHLPNHPHQNGIEAGIQRVSSSIFAHTDGATNAPLRSNGSDCWLPSGNHHARSSRMPPTSQYSPVSVPSSHSNGPPRAERLIHMSPALVPPPLATIPAPSYSKTNQLMFGIKVLPNQPPPYAQYSRLPQRFLHRQGSCEPSSVHPTVSNSSLGFVSPPLTRANSSQRNQTRSQLSATKPLCALQKDDAITSFIE
ncbi:unnamed protein product [Dicrocoelium dendriticum]|nr:unnamed protein product [Dicrocoelium dendriticum]